MNVDTYAHLLNPQQFRLIAGRFPTGVTVVTTSDPGGDPYGLAVNAFTSLSLDPPLVLVCLRQTSKTLSILVENGGFAINLLASNQAALCRRFAGRGGSSKFNRVQYVPSRLGHPIIHGVLGYLDCEVDATVPGGDHVIVTGVVRDGRSSDGEPLVFWRGQYTRVAPPRSKEHTLPGRRRYSAGDPM